MLNEYLDVTFNITNPFTNLSLSISNSNITNSNTYYYQEDLIVFTVNFNHPYSRIQQFSDLYLFIHDSSGNPVGDMYSLDVLSNSTAVLKINPKTENILPNSNYEVDIVFDCPGFQQTTSNTVYFNVFFPPSLVTGD